MTPPTLASLLLLPVALASYQVSDSGVIQGELPRTSWGQGLSSGLELQAAEDEAPAPPGSVAAARPRALAGAGVAPRREPGAVASVPLTAEVSDDGAYGTILWPQIGAEISMRGHASQKRAAAEDALLPQMGPGAASGGGRSPGEVSPEAGAQSLPLSPATEGGPAGADQGPQTGATVEHPHRWAAAAAAPGGARLSDAVPGLPPWIPKAVGMVADFGDQGSVHLFVLCLLNVLALIALFVLAQPGEARRAAGERKARFLEKVLRSHGRMPTSAAPRPPGGALSSASHPLPGSQPGHFYC